MTGRERWAVRAEPLDRLIYNDLRDASMRLAALGDNPPDVSDEGYAGWGDLVGDVFCAYRGLNTPVLTDAADLRPSRRLNSAIIQALTNPDGPFTATRAYTRGSDFEAAVATLTAADQLREIITTELADQAHAAQEADALEKQLEELSGSDDPEADAAAARIAVCLDELAQQQTEGTAAVKAAVEGAAEAAADAARSCGQLPGVGSGRTTKLPVDRQLDLADQWLRNPRLQHIVRLAGRLQRDMTRTRARRANGGRETPVAVTHTDDLSAMLAHEQMGFAVPALRRDTLQRLGQGALMSWQYMGEAPAADGPIILVVDSSGSMAGQRIVWAKAVCMAVVGMAHRARRDAAVIEFAGGNAITCDELPHRKTDPQALIEIAGRHLGGGTDAIDQALADAAALTKSAGAFQSADVILITDGHATVTDATRRTRQTLTGLGVRVQGITIHTGPSSYTDLMCDTQVEARNLAGPSDATRHIATHLT